VFLGLGMIAFALLWARRLRASAGSGAVSYRGPLLLGLGGVCVFLLWLLLVSRQATPA
jgi:hypothetical protein